jgi:hypothetical protein
LGRGSRTYLEPKVECTCSPESGVVVVITIFFFFPKEMPRFQRRERERERFDGMNLVLLYRSNHIYRERETRPLSDICREVG